MIPNGPSAVDVILYVDKCFNGFSKDDQGHVTIKDVCNLVKTRFKLSKIEKNMVKKIKSRLTELVNGNVRVGSMEEGVAVQANQPGRIPDKTIESKEVEGRDFSLTNQPGEPDVALGPSRTR